MDIIVVDDHSTDDCEAVVRTTGGNRVRYIRQPSRGGLVANLNSCLSYARGEFVHILHADDAVLPGFYEALGKVFDEDPTVGAAFCRVVYRDERSGDEALGPLLQESSGPVASALDQLLLGGPQTSSIVVRRDVYQAVGGFSTRFTCSCEDWEMWIRIAMHYKVGYQPSALAKYRYMRDGSLTELNRYNGRYARDLALAHRVVESYVPSSHGDSLRKARHGSAEWLLSEVALPLSKEGKRIPALRNLWYALRCASSSTHMRLALQVIRNLGPTWLRRA